MRLSFFFEGRWNINGFEAQDRLQIAREVSGEASLLYWASPLDAALRESQRQVGADGRVTRTQTGLLEAPGPCQGRPRESHRVMTPF